MPLSPFPPLESSRLVVRPVHENDLADLLEINGDDRVTRFLPYATWQSLDDGRAWLERTAGLTAAGATLQFVVAQRITGKVVGSCLLFRHEEASARAELGYVLGHAWWGMGIMAEALNTLMGHAFGPGGLRRLEAEVNPANEASLRLLLRLGFVREGLLRQRWAGKGQIYDSAVHGLLREEWRDPMAEEQLGGPGRPSAAAG